jgi:hypothetical protein
VAGLWAFDEANWQEIRESLAERDVNLDEVTVGKPMSPVSGGGCGMILP